MKVRIHIKNFVAYREGIPFLVGLYCYATVKISEIDFGAFFYKQKKVICILECLHSFEVLYCMMNVIQCVKHYDDFLLSYISLKNWVM